MFTLLRSTMSLAGPSKPGWPRLSSQCAVCRSWPAESVCTPCVARFVMPRRRCNRCAISLPPDTSEGLRSGPDLCANCAVHPPPLRTTLAAVPYAYPWSDLIGRYKFADQPAWAAFFASLLLRAPDVATTLGELDRDDWIVPMPLSAARLEARGFNQAWALATALARASGTLAKCDAGLLLRVRNTAPQSQLQRQARLANMRGAFQVDPLRAASLAGRRVVLVDDVMTSGASVFAAAGALAEAGAAEITALVLARTDSAEE